jgi:hypothetical protein
VRADDSGNRTNVTALPRLTGAEESALIRHRIQTRKAGMKKSMANKGKEQTDSSKQVVATEELKYGCYGHTMSPT